jgi:hypothetical protein
MRRLLRFFRPKIKKKSDHGPQGVGRDIGPSTAAQSTSKLPVPRSKDFGLWTRAYELHGLSKSEETLAGSRLRG